MRKYILWTFILVAHSSFHLYGQTVSSRQGDSLINRFDHRFEVLDSLILTPNGTTYHTHLQSVTLNTPTLSDYASRLHEEKYEADLRTMKSNRGFELSGQTYYRLDEGMGLDEEDAVSRYNAKVQMELAWDFFKSSYFNRKGKAREIYLEHEIARNRFEREQLSGRSETAKADLRTRYEHERAGLLLHRIENLGLLYSAYRHLVAEGGVSSDELLDILDEKTEAERMLAGFSGRHTPATCLAEPRCMTVSIDTAALADDLLQAHFDFRELELRAALLDQQYRNTNYLQNTTIAPFIRYSYYFRPELNNSSNVDVGVRLRLPLSGQSRKKRKSLAAEKRLLSLESAKTQEQILGQITRIVTEIHRLNQLSMGEIRRIRELESYLADRKHAYDNLIGKYSRPARMKEYNVYLACRESLVEFQYRRECLLCDLQSLMGDLPLDTYCTRIEL